MKEGWKFAIIALSIFASLILAFGPTGKITDNFSLTTTDGGGSGEIICAQNSETLCEGAYVSSYEDGCPVYDCPSCSEDDVKKYTCPNGVNVEWCHCSSNSWVCVNSPENACQSQTCSMPVCGGAEPHFTGDYDSYNCPVYDCPGMSCSPGLTSKYICSDGTSVSDCTCTSDGRWVCLSNPEWACPTPSCPDGCICNEETVTCSYSGGNGTTTTSASSGGGSEAVSAEVCPAGCLCSDDQIVCNQNITSNGHCAMGCELNESCVLPGIRTSINNSKQYCDINSEWKVQKNLDIICDNNFECETNLCIGGKCITQNFLDRIFGWFSNLFGGSKN